MEENVIRKEREVKKEMVKVFFYLILRSCLVTKKIGEKMWLEKEGDGEDDPYSILFTFTQF